MARITIDPITRIEGHLKIEVEVSNNTVADAWSSGTLFRGIELILKGRLPQDAWHYTQRLCGVCTYVHGVASVRCVEDMGNLVIPDNARVLRNLFMGTQYVHDHPIHFYHLHGADWIDVTKALTADPAATAALANSLSPNAPAVDFSAVKTQLANATANGQFGPFASDYGNHPAYVLTPEENLLLMGHYLFAIRQQLKAARMHALFGGKNPHLAALQVGGVTCTYEITAQHIADFKALLADMRTFIDTIYIPDATYVAKKYQPWASIGGSSNYLAYGEFPQAGSEPGSLFLPRGTITARNVSQPGVTDPGLVAEHVRHSWYAGDAALHPAIGVTSPQPAAYSTDDRYSWLKAPRYGGEPMEVGPLARILVAYGKGQPSVRAAVDGFLASAGMTLVGMHSTVGRIAARALETKLLADAMVTWIDQLQPGAPISITGTIPGRGMGMGLNEAPRGALGHWASLVGGKIDNYQMVVPSTWNFGPRDAAGKRGPVEQALIGTPVADPARPIEVLRVVHSFDPCLACAVHMIDRRSDRTHVVRVV